MNMEEKEKKNTKHHIKIRGGIPSIINRILCTECVYIQ